MNIPKIKSAEAIDNHTLVVVFDNNQKKKYDITPLLNNEMFSPLRNNALFKSLKVEHGGYAIVWNSNIDISEYELWVHGENMP
jgi:hypothetical protein